MISIHDTTRHDTTEHAAQIWFCSGKVRIPSHRNGTVQWYAFLSTTQNKFYRRRKSCSRSVAKDELRLVTRTSSSPGLYVSRQSPRTAPELPTTLQGSSASRWRVTTLAFLSSTVTYASLHLIHQVCLIISGALNLSKIFVPAFGSIPDTGSACICSKQFGYEVHWLEKLRMMVLSTTQNWMTNDWREAELIIHCKLNYNCLTLIWTPENDYDACYNVLSVCTIKVCIVRRVLGLC